MPIYMVITIDFYPLHNHPSLSRTSRRRHLDGPGPSITAVPTQPAPSFISFPLVRTLFVANESTETKQSED